LDFRKVLEQILSDKLIVSMVWAWKNNFL
jgi:hypothetical protein